MTGKRRSGWTVAGTVSESPRPIARQRRWGGGGSRAGEVANGLLRAGLQGDDGEFYGPDGEPLPE